MTRILNAEKYRITQNAWQTNVVTGTYHKGSDIVSTDKPQGCEIKAHSDGTIVTIVNNHNYTDKTGSSYGNYVKIKHPNGYFTLYAHLKEVYVTVGQVVSKGDYIGFMGMTGRATGIHVHYEVFNPSNEKINPTEFIEGDLPNLRDGTNIPETGTNIPETGTDNCSPQVFSIGEKVLVLNGYLTADSYGGGTRTATYNGDIAPNDITNYLIVTQFNWGAPRPIHLRRLDERGATPMGWATREQIRKL